MNSLLISLLAGTIQILASCQRTHFSDWYLCWKYVSCDLVLKLCSFIYIVILNTESFNASCKHKSIVAVLVCKNWILFIPCISVFASSLFSHGEKWDITRLTNPSSLTCRLWCQALLSEQLQKFPFSISDTTIRICHHLLWTPQVKILRLTSVLCLSHALESKKLKY